MKNKTATQIENLRLQKRLEREQDKNKYLESVNERLEIRMRDMESLSDAYRKCMCFAMDSAIGFNAALEDGRNRILTEQQLEQVADRVLDKVYSRPKPEAATIGLMNSSKV